jgi:NitT/TauT family transport system substrate-binding protein
MWALPSSQALCASLACGALVAGCGSSEGGEGGTGKPATIRVGATPIADVAPLYLGVKQGFFKQEKLTIEPEPADVGVAVVAAVVRGSDDVGFGNTTTLTIAASKNLPLQIIAPGAQAAARPTRDQAWDAVLVKKGSSITSPSDLEGKTVSVNTLQNIGPLAINTALRRRGVDYRKVRYIEVPFTEANVALEAGRVDAAWVIEPYLSQGLDHGSRPLLYPYEETASSLPVAAYYANKRFIGKHPDVVDRFVRAIDRSLEYAQSHPDEVRRIVPTYTKIPAATAQKMKLAQWRSSLSRPAIERMARLAKEYGYLKKEPDIDELIREP